MKCPNETELSSFLTGQLPPDRLSHVASHCEECAICQGSLETLVVGSDTVVNALRHGMPNMPFVREEPCLSLVDRTQLEVDGPIGSAAVSGVLHANDRIGQYQIVSLLGQGGMGAVYEARHLKLKRTVALKLLPDHRMWPEDIARFEREMASVGQLSHPNIVTAHDAGEVDGHHYLAMELLSGVDLSKLSKSHGPLAVGAACELIRQAAIGLHCAHENGMVHRDIKPSNLMLTNDGTVKVLDLGLARLQAKATEEDGSELTSTGDVMGTINYMAAEQGNDSTRVGPAADIYSLGATLHKLLTGVAPYTGEQLKTMMQKLSALATEDPPSIKTRRTDLPADIVSLVDSMTRRSPDQRPATMAEVAQRLEPFADASALATLLESGAPNASVAITPTKVPVKTQTPAASTPNRGKRWLAVLASVVIAAVLMFGLSQIRVSTKSGDIVITIEGGVPVTITEETVTFKDPADGQTVRVGVDHDGKKIRVGKPGFETVTEEVDMTSEDGRRISIKFEPKAIPLVHREPPKTPKKPTSELAEETKSKIIKLLKAGGGDAKEIPQGLNLHFVDGHTVDVAQVAQMGARAEIDIAWLNVASPADLKEFADYAQEDRAQITTVRLYGNKHNDESLSLVEQIAPSELVLEHTDFDTSDLGRLFRSNQWRLLAFNNQKLDSEAMKALKHQKKLHYLQFTGAQGLDDWDMQELQETPLKTLHLRHTRVSDKAFDSIGKISTLKTLNVGGIVRSEDELDKAIESIGQLKNLNELLFFSRYTRASDLKPLVGSLEALTSLHCWVNPDSFEGFESFTKLRLLSLDFTKIGDGQQANMQWLPSLKKLKRVRLSHATGEQLRYFKKSLPKCEFFVIPDFGWALHD